MVVERVIGDLRGGGGDTTGSYLVRRSVRGVIINGRYELPQPWTPSTTYGLGVLVTNGGDGPPAFNRTYQVITGGESAGSGGPLTTASDIVDGTVHWKYIEDNWITIVASWRPKTGRVIASPAQGQYGNEDRWMFSVSELRTIQPGLDGSPNTESDIVVIEEEDWQVVHVDRGRRFFRAMLTRLPLP